MTTTAPTTAEVHAAAVELVSAERRWYTGEDKGPEVEARFARAAGARYAAELCDRHSCATVSEAMEMLDSEPRFSGAWAEGFVATAKLILGDL